MNVRTVRTKATLQEIESALSQATDKRKASGLLDELEEQKQQKQPSKIQMENHSSELLEIVQRQSQGDWLVWNSTAEDFQLVVSHQVSIEAVQDDLKGFAERQVEEFAFRIDKTIAQSGCNPLGLDSGVSIDPNDTFSIIDVCQHSFKLVDNILTETLQL